MKVDVIYFCKKKIIKKKAFNHVDVFMRLTCVVLKSKQTLRAISTAAPQTPRSIESEQKQQFYTCTISQFLVSQHFRARPLESFHKKAKQPRIGKKTAETNQPRSERNSSERPTIWRRTGDLNGLESQRPRGTIRKQNGDLAPLLCVYIYVFAVSRGFGA